MKKLAYTAFVAFCSSVTTLLAVAWLSAGRSVDAEETLPAYTHDDVAAHATVESCWMAIDERVYDITAYIPQHPTPAGVLLPWCGREATEGMRTKGYGRDHSSAAWAMLAGYLIGTLEQ
jgi:cytochrome b involved in lipid metabolism